MCQVPFAMVLPCAIFARVGTPLALTSQGGQDHRLPTGASRTLRPAPFRHYECLIGDISNRPSLACRSHSQPIVPNRSQSQPIVPNRSQSQPIVPNRSQSCHRANRAQSCPIVANRGQS